MYARLSSSVLSPLPASKCRMVLQVLSSPQKPSSESESHFLVSNGTVLQIHLPMSSVFKPYVLTHCTPGDQFDGLQPVFKKGVEYMIVECPAQWKFCLLNYIALVKGECARLHPGVRLG